MLVGIVVTLVLVEFAFRLLWTLPPWFAEFQQAGMYVATPDEDTALQPGYRGTLQIGARTTTVAINRLGLRGAELAAKAAGERRVLVVGDSLVFGYGVEAEQALPARLEAALRTSGVQAVVGNGGVPSYGSRHAVAHLARLDQPFAPDAFVVCSFLGNDAIDDTSPQRTVYAGLMLQGPWVRLVRTSWRTRLAYRSRAALWVEAWILTNKPEWSPVALMTPDPEDALRTAGLPPERPTDQRHAGLFLDVLDEQTCWDASGSPPIPRLRAVLRASLQRAQQQAGRRPLVFVILPTIWQVDEGKRTAHLKELGFDPSRFARGVAQQRWREVATELGVPVFDATPILAADPDPASLYVDGGHLNERGNALLGDWLAGELQPLLTK
jgi:lysophospholipase L1-like esterase